MIRTLNAWLSIKVNLGEIKNRSTLKNALSRDVVLYVQKDSVKSCPNTACAIPPSPKATLNFWKPNIRPSPARFERMGCSRLNRFLIYGMGNRADPRMALCILDPAHGP